jgi:glutamate-1-semialdehyde aminotransferase
MKLAKSKQLKIRADAVIPDQTQTAAKTARRFVQGMAPMYLDRGDGAYVWDVDGNRFLDFTMALLPIVLGHSDPDVNLAVKQQVDRGVLFTLPGPLEVEVSEELLKYWVPWARYVRFFKTGSEATTASIRLARAVTGRDKIAVVQPGYHGWHDWFIACQLPAIGVPTSAKKEIIVVERNNKTHLNEVLRNTPVAALIMEPRSLEKRESFGRSTALLSDTASDFLIEARQVCDATGALLIVDEVVTGIRANPTVASSVPVQADLMTLGKAVANGYPLAALVGSDAMKMLNQDEVFVSGTYGGELISLAAAKATLKKLRTPLSYSSMHGNSANTPLSEMFDWGSRIMRMVESVAPPSVEVLGTPIHFVMRFKDRTMADFWQQECIKRGVLFTGNHNIALAHCNLEVTETIQRVYEEVAMEVKTILSSGQSFADRLEGEPTRPAFSGPKRL